MKMKHLSIQSENFRPYDGSRTSHSSPVPSPQKLFLSCPKVLSKRQINQLKLIAFSLRSESPPSSVKVADLEALLEPINVRQSSWRAGDLDVHGPDKGVSSRTKKTNLFDFCSY